MARIHSNRRPRLRDARPIATGAWTELAHRCGDGVDVTLIWLRQGDADRVRVCVCDRREGAYFELEPAPRLALDVFYHPFSYRGSSTLDYADSRLAA
jgi:hypothetical protein